jgi:hypothetical protein
MRLKQEWGPSFLELLVIISTIPIRFLHCEVWQWEWLWCVNCNRNWWSQEAIESPSPWRWIMVSSLQLQSYPCYSNHVYHNWQTIAHVTIGWRHTNANYSASQCWLVRSKATPYQRSRYCVGLCTLCEQAFFLVLLLAVTSAAIYIWLL